MPPLSGLPTYSRKNRIKLVLGSVFRPFSSRRWHDYVAQSDLLRDAARLDARLLTKIYRPYFVQQYSCAQRVQALIEHYEINRALGLEPLTRELLEQPRVLHRGLGKSGGHFELELSAMERGHREGEYCLTLSWNGVKLYDMNFQFAGMPSRPRLVLSRFHAALKDEDAREALRALTKELHGARPVNLMLHAARNLGWLWGCEAVLLLADRQRVALNPWRRLKLKSTYDDVWIEAGARLLEDGFYELEPMGLRELDLSRIASKKRAEATRRNELLNRLTSELQAALGHRSGSRETSGTGTSPSAGAPLQERAIAAKSEPC